MSAAAADKLDAEGEETPLGLVVENDHAVTGAGDKLIAVDRVGRINSTGPPAHHVEPTRLGRDLGRRFGRRHGRFRCWALNELERRPGRGVRSVCFVIR